MFKSFIVINMVWNLLIIAHPSTSHEKSGSKGKVVFVPVVVDKDKKPAWDGVPKTKFVPPSKRQFTYSFVPTCYHCSNVGHIVFRGRTYISVDLVVTLGWNNVLQCTKWSYPKPISWSNGQCSVEWKKFKDVTVLLGWNHGRISSKHNKDRDNRTPPAN